jgi:hypothetical protein
MKFQHVGRLVMTHEFIKSLAVNVQLQQVYADVMSPFIVIEARLNPIDDTLEQIIFDPAGTRLPRVTEGELIPKVTLNFGKVPSVMSIHDNPFYANLVIPS